MAMSPHAGAGKGMYTVPAGRVLQPAAGGPRAEWNAQAARARRVLTEASVMSPGETGVLPQVTCVVLNWNGWRDTLDCLACLSRMDYPRLSVLVVDNGSTDESVSRICAAFPGIPILQSLSNLGFAAGTNLGVRAALESGADYVWVLNNDTQPRPSSLRALVLRAESDPRLGAVGSVLPYLGNEGCIQAWGGGRINIWTARVQHAHAPHDERWFQFLTAASVLLRRQALETCGLFDEGFFLYWEDVDLSYRLRRRGWRLGVAAGSIVPHREHASTQRNFRVLDRYAVASGIRFMLKHSPAPCVSIGVLLVLKIGKRIATGRLGAVMDIVGGVLDYRERCRQRSIAARRAALPAAVTGGGSVEPR
jgi:GT2 family glycosyltransferase